MVPYEETVMTINPPTNIHRSNGALGSPALDDECGLCHKRGAEARDGRLGRYAKTCDSCEAARGSHLAQAS